MLTRRSRWNREARPGEFCSALSLVFGIASVLAGWIFLPPIVGIALALLGNYRSLPDLDGAVARSWSTMGLVLSVGGLIGWIGVLLFVF